MGQGVQGESRTRRERLGPGLMRVAAPAGDAVGPLLLPMNKGVGALRHSEETPAQVPNCQNFYPRRESYLRSAGASERHRSRILSAGPPVTT